MRWGKGNQVAPYTPDETGVGGTPPELVREPESVATIAAAKKVNNLLDLSEDQTTAPALPRVEAKLAMVVTYHRIVEQSNGKMSTKVSRHMGYAVDNAPYLAFRKQVAQALHMDDKEANKLVITYSNTRGVTQPIKDTATLRSWFDEWWCYHPLQLHAFDPKLAEQEFDRTEVIRDAFARYDHNGSGVLSATEWRQMLRELCESSDFKPEDMDLERWPTDLQKWAQHEFLKADANGDGVVTLLEFTRYYHTMHEFLRHRLAKSAKTNTIRKQLAEAFLEARSFRRPLSVVLGALEGVLLLDAYGHDYGVELYFSQDECARAECDATRWVRAQTLLDSKVDAYTDPSNTIGEIRFAPIVQIEFESDGDASGASGASPPCVLTMPHCFDLEDLEMEDIVVVTAQMSMTGAKGEWSIVDPARVRLINPPGLSDSSCFSWPTNAPRPAIEITIPAGSGGAIYTVFGKALTHDHTIGQRVVCLAFTPEKIMPIELENMNLHFVPDLPEQFDIAYQAEQQQRGLVAFGGRSRLFRVELPHSRIHVQVDQSMASGNYLNWHGTHAMMTFEFDPENFLEAPPPSVDVDANAVANFALAGFQVEKSAAEELQREQEVAAAAEAREEWRAKAEEMLVTESGKKRYVDLLEAELLKLQNQRRTAEENLSKAKKERIAAARARGLMIAQQQEQLEADKKQDEADHNDLDEKSERRERRHLRHDTRGKIEMHLTVRDGPEVAHMSKSQRKRRESLTHEDPLAYGKLHSKMALHEMRSPHSHSFGVDILIHGFLPPTEPTDVIAAARTNTYLVLEWSHPKKWGGCSIDRYEVQLIEISAQDVLDAAKRAHQDAKDANGSGDAPRNISKLSTTQAFNSKGFKKKDWRTVYEEMPIETGKSPTARIPIQLFAGRVRVRAFNTGCATPSRWSKVLHIGTFEEEKASLEIEKAARGLHARKELKAKRQAAGKGNPEDTANLKKAHSAGAGTADGGTALVEHGAVDDLVGTKVVKSMRGWPLHKKQLGQLWLDLGVPGGLNGRLMDLTLTQVDALVEGQGHDADGLSADKPLISLARCSCWVMETLAHHTDNPDEWIDLMNDVEGLVNLAVHQRIGFDEGTTPFVRQIIHTLLELFETMRQAEPEGYITRMLNGRYSKATKRHLRKVWKRRLEGLREELATSVNSMVLHNRLQGIEQLALLGSSTHTRTLYHFSGGGAGDGDNDNALSIAASAAAKGRGAHPEAEHCVVLTRLHATGIRGGSTPDTTLRALLVKGGRSASTTRAGKNVNADEAEVEASWNDDVVTLPLESASAAERGMRLKLQLWGGAGGQTLLGTNTIELLGACGRVENLRIFADGDEEGALEAEQVELSLDELTLLPMIHFSFRVTTWLKEDLIEPNIDSISPAESSKKDLFTSNRMWWAWGETRIADTLRAPEDETDAMAAAVAQAEADDADGMPGLRAASSLKQTWRAVGKHAHQSVWKKPKIALMWALKQI